MNTLAESMISISWTAVLWTIVAICLAVRYLTSTNPQKAHTTQDASGSTSQAVHLTNVTPERNKGNTEIDIIAIHGLDTKSPDTWTWKSRDEGSDVNWLADSDMLPRQVQNARIFTYDWPAQLFQNIRLAPVSIEEYATLLLDQIRCELLSNDQDLTTRPILFIASCLGGIILAKALIIASENKREFSRITQATRGVVFLATSFRGTSLQHVKRWAGIALSFTASRQRKQVTALIDLVKSETRELGNMVRRFTSLYQYPNDAIELYSFYEGEKTSLPRKIFPWLPEVLQKKQLVRASIFHF